MYGLLVPFRAAAFDPRGLLITTGALGKAAEKVTVKMVAPAVGEDPVVREICIRQSVPVTVGPVGDVPAPVPALAVGAVVLEYACRNTTSPSVFIVDAAER